MRPELEAAVAAVGAARAAIARGGADQITSKGGRDLVTAADVAAEDAIRAELLRRFPSIPVVGEERGGRPASAGRPYWLVDPICGTRSFASGIPVYATNVTLVEGGEAVLAAVGDGGTGAVYTAESGAGAWMTSAEKRVPLRAGDVNPILWVAPGGARAGEWTVHAAAFLQAALLADRWFVWTLGSTLPLAYLAGGRIAAYIEFPSIGPLHTAAGCLLVREAGGVVTDLSGRPWTIDSGAFIAAATADLHRDLLALVQETRPATPA